MTLQEAKDQVAKKYGAPDWWSLDFNKTNLSQEAVRDEAALLYGEQKWIEACGAQKEICCNRVDVTMSEKMIRFNVLAAPIPPFKP